MAKGMRGAVKNYMKKNPSASTVKLGSQTGRTYNASKVAAGDKGTMARMRAGIKADSKLKGYKKGGMVKKTGKAKVHKGEMVVPKKKVKKVKKAMKINYFE